MTEPAENNSGCACAEHLRAECRGEQLFRNTAGEAYCLWHYPGAKSSNKFTADNKFVCGCHKYFHFACSTEPFFKSHEGKDYCVLHYPANDKIESFRAALRKKFAAEDFDFSGVWFPEEVYFNNFTFSANIYFYGAIFSANTYFYGAIFSAKADFRDATFSAETNFRNASFSAETYFHNARFSAKADFSKVTFSAKADFMGAIFSAKADFSDATFSAQANFLYDETFSAKANFSSSSFRAEADFRDATFCAEASFFDATFSAKANFNKAIFSAKSDFFYATFNATADFRNATFNSEASFLNATFSAKANFSSSSFRAKADFRDATFKDYVRFSGTKEKDSLGKKSSLNFQFAQVEKPERVLFHTLSLRPYWFINVDSRKFEFTDVEWNYRLEDELQSASEHKVSASHRLLAIACRQLADNAEANHRYYEASRFRYHAFEVRRIETVQSFVPWLKNWWRDLASSFKPWRLDWWRDLASSFKPWRLDWWYWLASGYGENVGRAFFVFIMLISFFAFAYTFSEFDTKLTEKEPTSLSYLSQVRSVTGSPSPTPQTITTPVLVNTFDWQVTTLPPLSHYFANSNFLPPKKLLWHEAALYSFNVSIFQKPESKPKDFLGNLLIAMETILGPAQAALLGLAVRRRFMRQ